MEIPLDVALPCIGVGDGGGGDDASTNAEVTMSSTTNSFRNFALLRHPVDRLVSHMRERHWTPETVQQAVEPKIRIAPSAQSVKSWMRLKYSCINNMVIRVLLGLSRFRSPQPINETDLAQAKHIIDQFTAFVPTEQQYHPNVMALLRNKLPEYHEGLVKLPEHYKKSSSSSSFLARDLGKIRVESNSSSNHSHSSQFSAEFIQLLYEQNKYDLLLYDYVHERLGLPHPAKDKKAREQLFLQGNVPY